jgi:hypothetical protein
VSFQLIQLSWLVEWNGLLYSVLQRLGFVIAGVAELGSAWSQTLSLLGGTGNQVLIAPERFHLFDSIASNSHSLKVNT